MPISPNNYSDSEEPNKVERSLKRTRSSPGSLSERNKRRQFVGQEEGMTPTKREQEVGKMSMEQLMSSFSKLLDSKNFATRADIITLEKHIAALSEENKMLRKEIEILRKRDSDREKQVENFENRLKRNNIVFRGLECKNDESLSDKIKDFCSDVLGVERDKLQINDAFTLGKPEGNHVKVATFSNYQVTMDIMSKASRLKGTSFVVHRDYSYGTRKRRRQLILAMKEVKRLNPQIKVSIRSERLLVEGCYFEWDFSKGLIYKKYEDVTRKLNEICGINLSEWTANELLRQESTSVSPTKASIFPASHSAK